MSASAITRRELVRKGGLLSLVPALLRGGSAAAEPAASAAKASAKAAVPRRPACGRVPRSISRSASSRS